MTGTLEDAFQKGIGLAQQHASVTLFKHTCGDMFQNFLLLVQHASPGLCVGVHELFFQQGEHYADVAELLFKFGTCAQHQCGS
jgi:hypothetical protein